MVAYTQSATDVLGVSDTNVANNYGLTGRDSLGIVDAASTGTGTGKIQTATDVMGITDISGASSLTNYTQTPTDAMGLSDGTAAQDLADDIADTISITDAVSTAATGANALQRVDAFGIADAVTTQLSGLTARTFTDPMNTADAATTFASNPNSRTLIDTMGLADAATQNFITGPQAYTRSFNDRNNITDSIGWGGTVTPPSPTVLRSNLAVNPSGEQGAALNWVSTGGTVKSSFITTASVADYLESDTSIDVLTDSVTDTPLENSTGTGSTDVTITPYTGFSVVEYQVTDPNALSYRLTPLGQAGDPQYGGFKINATSRSIAFSARVASSAPATVQARARLMSLVGTTLTDRGTVNIGSPTVVTSSWTAITGSVAVSDAGATHWFLDLDFSGGGTPPSVGTVFAADAMYVPGTGTILAGETYFDGSTPGAYWSGTPNASISYYGTQVVTPPEDTGSTDPGTTPGTVPPADTDPSPTEPELPANPPPVVETPPGEDPAVPTGEVLTSEQQATRILARVTAGGICLNEDVQIGDLVLNRLDENGVLWVVTDIEGWWTLPEPDMPDYTRGLADGSYQVRGRYSSRVITLSGSFFPSSPEQVRLARDKLIRNIDLCHRGAWFMTHESDASKGSLMWLSGQPLIATTKSSGRTDFSIGLKAPDPIKYGLAGGTPPGWKVVTLSSKTVNTSSIGRRYNRTYPWSYPTNAAGGVIATDATVINDGNTRVFPIMTLRGPTAGRIVIQNLTTGQKMRVMKRLYAGDTLIIDCYNKQVSLNGTPNQRFYLDLLTDWIYAAPGENQLFWYDEEASSSGSLTVQWRPGWIG